MMILTWNRKFS